MSEDEVLQAVENTRKVELGVGSLGWAKNIWKPKPPHFNKQGEVNFTRKRLIDGSSSRSLGKKKKSSLLPKKISSETMKSDSKNRKRGPDDMDYDDESSSKSIKKQENIRYRILKEQMQRNLGDSWLVVMKEFFHDKFRNFLNRLTGVEEFDIDSGESIVNPVGSLLSNMDIDSDE